MVKWTLLASTDTLASNKDAEIVIELSYSDIEGTEFAPERFKLDLLPGDGALYTTKRSYVNGKVEEVELRPDSG